jgi:hypothetical protein
MVVLRSIANIISIAVRNTEGIVYRTIILNNTFGLVL